LNRLIIVIRIKFEKNIKNIKNVLILWSITRVKTNEKPNKKRVLLALKVLDWGVTFILLKEQF